MWFAMAIPSDIYTTRGRIEIPKPINQLFSSTYISGTGLASFRWQCAMHAVEQRFNDTRFADNMG